ncbi:MAG: putative toxin-antitoxin system toxin component, PIN family [Nitriliruptor sp.]|uniref:putative toxin-antitoxin system toxin component, PIN family n=1 Tax=Nitriliruptor sp. TaxID=2448056 RepID=UPI0034A00905
MITVQRRVVLDPGVLLSGFISSGGITASLLDAVLERRVVAIVSPRLVRELHTVLLRDKFRRYASPEEVDAFVVRLLASSDVVDDPQQVPAISRDPDDDYIIALARAEQDVVVSGDDDLLTLELSDVEVLTPRVFLETLVDPG